MTPFFALQDRDANNNVTRDYLWGLNFGGGIGGLLNLRQGGQGYDYLYNGIGNVVGLINANQQVAASYTYDAFGKLLNKAESVSQPFQFSTKRYEPRIGLNYYGYRFYNAGIGRWMNRDPLGEAGGINLYGFVGNNPVNFVDPWGLNPAAGGASKFFGWGMKQLSKQLGKKAGGKLGEWADFFNPEIGHPPEQQEMDKDTDGDGLNDYEDDDDDNDGIPDDIDLDPKNPGDLLPCH